MPIKDVILGKNVSITNENLVNLYGCKIGDNCKIGPFVEIQKNAIIGGTGRIGLLSPYRNKEFRGIGINSIY